MDKQKQMIEEMAKDICGYCLRVIEEKECPRTENQHCFNARLEEATYAYKLGYRKIPENAVVLTDEEWAEHCEQFAKAMYQKEVNTRKETAEKFVERLKATLTEIIPFEDYEIGDWEYDGMDIANAIDEICKEFTEGQE